MKLDTRKTMAADVLGVGKSRVWLDPEELTEIDNAITKEDIRTLIKRGIILELPKATPSRGRIREHMQKKKRGQRKGVGSRKGTANARYSSKRRHIDKIRALRKNISELKDTKRISVNTYRKLYNLSRGGYFRDKTHLNNYIKDNKLMQ